MLKAKEDRTDYLRSALFMVLLFFFISAFSNHTEKHIGTSHFRQTVTEWNAGISAANNNQQHFFQKSLIPLTDKSNFRLFNQNCKIIADNRLIKQRFFVRIKAELRIKPLAILRFKLLHRYNYNKDLPVLS